MSGHHLFDFFQVLPDFFEHGLLGGQTDFVIRFPLSEISGQGFFTDDVLIRLGGLKDHGQVEGVGDDQVHDVDRLVVQEAPVVVVAFLDPEQIGQIFGPALVHIHDGGDLHGNALDLAVGAQMKGPRETGTHNAHPHCLAHKIRSFRERMEGKMQRGSEFKLKV